jgi:hypothetical protein
MDNKSIKILIVAIVPIVVLILYIRFSYYFSLYDFSMIFIFANLVAMVLLLYQKHSSNATLTCKNGHTCRVRVNSSRRSWRQNNTEPDLIYPGGGEPTITPKRCPKCGADWQVPHKRDKPLTLDYYRNMK